MTMSARAIIARVPPNARCSTISKRSAIKGFDGRNGRLLEASEASICSRLGRPTTFFSSSR